MSYESEYLGLCQKILDEGEWVENKRTGKRCKTIINHDFVYDVGNKEVPLLTTKQCFTVSAVAEVLGYLRGYDNAQDFADIGSPTWFGNASNPKWVANPNRKGEGDMGKTYQFGLQGYTVEVSPAYRTPPKQDISLREELDVFYPTLDSNEDYLGKVFSSVASGQYKITEYLGCSVDKRIHFFTAKFVETGTEVKIQKSQIRDGYIKDYKAVSVYGVGYLGCVLEEEDKVLYKVWNHMLERCYSPKSEHYSNYGGSGVFVESSWHCFAKFKEDVKGLPNYYLHKEYPKLYTLDKDFYHSNYYSPYTCKWASKTEQARNRSSSKDYKVVSTGVYLKGMKSVQEHFNLTRPMAEKMVKEGEVIEVREGTAISYIEVNNYLDIYCKLKNKHDDRGLITTAWLPHLEQLGCLRPCAYEHIWSLVGDKLSLTVVQRAADLALGIPFNSFSFYFLLELMAKITGNIPDKVYHKLINVHVYEDQIEPLKEQLARTPFKCNATFDIAPWVSSMEDVILDTHAREYFTLRDYEHQGKITFPFSA